MARAVAMFWCISERCGGPKVPEMSSGPTIDTRFPKSAPCPVSKNARPFVCGGPRTILSKGHKYTKCYLASRATLDLILGLWTLHLCSADAWGQIVAFQCVAPRIVDYPAKATLDPFRSSSYFGDIELLGVQGLRFFIRVTVQYFDGRWAFGWCD